MHSGWQLGLSFVVLLIVEESCITLTIAYALLTTKATLLGRIKNRIRGRNKSPDTQFVSVLTIFGVSQGA